VEIDAGALAPRGPVSLEIVTRLYPGYRRVFAHTARMPIVIAGVVSVR